MTLRELLLYHDSGITVKVLDAMTGEILCAGSDSSIMHSLQTADYDVDYFGVGDDGCPFLYVEVL